MKNPLLVFTFLISALGFGLERVEFQMSTQASVLFTELLLRAPRLSEVSLEGGASAESVQAATCHATAFRVQGDEPEKSHPESGIRCEFTQESASGSVTLSLGNETLFPWGRFGSSKAFQFHGPLVSKVARLIKSLESQSPQHPLFSTMDFHGPEGHRILSYGIKSEPDKVDASGRLIDYSTLAIDCSFNLQHENLHQRRCVVFYFD